MKHAQSITDKSVPPHLRSTVSQVLLSNEFAGSRRTTCSPTAQDALSFDSIIASGPNGANPHAQPGERVVQTGDMIVMDMAGLSLPLRYDPYCCCWRTFRSSSMSLIVRKANETCAAAIHAGVTGSLIFITLQLRLSLRLATVVLWPRPWPQCWRSRASFFNPRWNKVIAAGSVVTDEPGIYLPGKFGITLRTLALLLRTATMATQSHDLVSVGC